jgi:hypothetical protein
METLNLLNGNKQIMNKTLPALKILGYMNDVAIEHIAENTGLNFIKDSWGNLEAQPTESKQIVALFMTYNFKTRYYDNWNYSNTIVLKGDHHVGFDVNSICTACASHNGINIEGLTQDSRLSC